MNTKAGNRLVDVHAVHAMTGISVYTIRQMARENRIPARKLGRLVRFVPVEIEAWLAKLPKAGR